MEPGVLLPVEEAPEPVIPSLGTLNGSSDGNTGTMLATNSPKIKLEPEFTHQNVSETPRGSTDVRWWRKLLELQRRLLAVESDSSLDQDIYCQRPMIQWIQRWRCCICDEFNNLELNPSCLDIGLRPHSKPCEHRRCSHCSIY
jgi:hypothetical protein